MKCYNHPNLDAVGTCKSCSKGLCHECITEVGKSIACTKTCVDEVKVIDKMIRNSLTATQRKSNLVAPFFLISIGLFFIYIGWKEEVGHFSFPIGALMAFWGLVSLFIILKRRNDTK